MKHPKWAGSARNITVVSGGQSGVDRAALDAAAIGALDYKGWCPGGGWAEDMPEPPGLLSKYPELRETASSAPEERTEMNVADSDATLVLLMTDEETPLSGGTRLTAELAEKYDKPLLIADLNDPAAVEKIIAWLAGMPGVTALNIAGPRESESPGIYEKAKAVLTTLFAGI